MKGLRWFRFVQACLDLSAGFALGAFTFSGRVYWALIALALVIAGVAWDAGEKLPGDAR